MACYYVCVHVCLCTIIVVLLLHFYTLHFQGLVYPSSLHHTLQWSLSAEAPRPTFAPLRSSAHLAQLVLLLHLAAVVEVAQPGSYVQPPVEPLLWVGLG